MPPFFYYTLLYLEDDNSFFWRFFLLKINYRNAGTAELNMLIGIMRHIWNAAQVLPDELSENSVALAMKNSNSWHTYQDGIVNEILNGIQCFIATHTSYIQILVEVGFMRVNGLSGFLTDTV